jgi:phage repressor protein C with HTH and peptisase S24 domain
MYLFSLKQIYTTFLQPKAFLQLFYNQNKYIFYMSDIQRDRNNKKLIRAVNFLKMEFPVKEISERLAVDKGNISSYLSGSKSVSKKFLEKFAKEFKVDLSQFDTDDLDKDILDNKINLEKRIPLVMVKVIGGFGGSEFSIQESDIKEYYVIPKFKNKQVDFMIEVEGPSMYPNYSSGDVVACTVISESKFIQWGKTHVVATKSQGIIIKKIKQGSEGNLLMVSDNTGYDPFEVPIDDITGIARVVGVIRLE